MNESAPTSRSLPPVIITIDGPAGTGKSTVAFQLARRLGVEFLDTGAMYRAAALLAVEQGIDPSDGPALARAVRESDMHFDWSADPPRIMLHDRDVSAEVREMRVSEVVSRVAAQSALRKVLVEQQQRIAQRHPRLVSEGRDQGSVVFPDASVQFFLHADVAVRAERRMAQLSRIGQAVDAEVVSEDIRRRDRIDASRSDSPLVRPEHAVDIDTSRKTVAEVVDEMEAVVRERLPDAGFIV